jgi:putative transposase
MSDYRRLWVPGGSYFFTVVTHQRQRYFAESVARRHLREAMTAVRQRWPFSIVALVLLPDHLHTVWSLPANDFRYDLRWRRIKDEFTRRFLRDGKREGHRSESRVRRGERGIWQRRFWEHTCHDEDDLRRCVDYTHWNPKKHGYVQRIVDWRWSTFHRFANAGEYESGWGGVDPVHGFGMPDID